eukprot:snap_masked-scaffold_1-processed-gene-24.35-mRNA-1 protein AED:1.00 eAED:1.00 QI:0/-1/0/0/-1/1/1/0/413
MPHPKGISCELCGKQFFKRSYPIHLKSCRKKYEYSFSKCPKCDVLVSKDEYSEHFAVCTVKKKKKKRIIKTVESERPVIPLVSCEEEVEDQIGDAEFKREECCICNRKFAPGRIAKHQTICVSNASRKERKKFPSASESRLRGTEFKKFFHSGKSINAAEKKKRHWRQEHANLRCAVEQGRLVHHFQENEIPLSYLPKIDEIDLTEYQKDLEKVPEEIRTRICEVLEKLALTSGAIDEVYGKKELKKSKSGYFGTKEAMMFKVGDEVCFRKAQDRCGTVKFIGLVDELPKGYWLGLELKDMATQRFGDSAVVDFKKYFDVATKKGLLVRPTKVIRKDLLQIVKKKRKQNLSKRIATPEKTMEKEIDIVLGKEKLSFAEKFRETVKQSPRFEVTKTVPANDTNLENTSYAANRM